MGTKNHGASGSHHRVDTWRTARAVLFIAILATFVSLAPPKNATAATAGLVAAYGFDAGSGTTVADQSGNGNNGTVANTTWAATGKYGKALQFNGSSALVTIPDAASLHLTTAMTLEAWVNPSTVNGNWRDVIYKGNDNYYLEATSTNSSKPDGGLIAGGSYGDAFGTAALPANTWSYLAETYDGSTLRLYVNGTQVASTAHTGAISTSANPLQIGGDSIYGQFFAGMIDEVRIYNTALTATQIQTDQTTPITPTGPTYSVGGSVSGLSGTVVLQDNGGDNLSVSANGPFTFATQLVGGAAYSVTVKTNPSGQTCSVSNGSGTIGSANVTNVAVSCTTAPTFSVGGSVSGLVGTVVLQDNGGDDLSVSTNGPFTFATQLVGGAAYSVTVKTNPSGQTCSVSNGSGTIGSANVTNVAVSCTTATGPTGLVAAYGFDAGSGTTVADQSGNGNNGTVANTTWAATGKYGKALQFNGSSALVTIPDAASLHLTTAMTLEAWVNPSTVNGNWRDVIYKGNDNYYLEATSTNSSKPDGGLIAGGSYGDAFGTAALPANTWSYLAETYDGSTLRLYVNGTQVASTAHTGAISTSANPLQIGGDSIYGQFFAGMIDEVRIYNTALTATQIQTDQTTPITPTTPDTQPPTQPGTLSANAVSAGEVDLSWGASTDNVAVTGYLIERCLTASCTFTQIGATNGSTTTYKDTAVAASTGYSYRVRATDAVPNLGPYSNTATATTPTAAFAVSPKNAVLTFTRTQQYTAQGAGSVTWLVDGVAGGNSSSGTITSGGLYTPPSTVGSHTISAATGTGTASVTAYVSNYAGTFTFHNDNARDGENLNETVLTPSNVNSTTFGKLFSYPLDGLTFASPLYAPNVNIPGQGFHNLVIVATEHDSVYAFDADGRSNTPVWKDSFINPAAGVTPIPPADTGETGDIPNEIGITGTPVIDPSTNTVYVVAATKEVSGGTTTYVNRLHALDLTSGAEKFGGPIVIKASVPGSGGDNVNGTISFNNITENQRPALTLQNGELYIGFSNHGNNPPYHGWVMAYNASTLHQDWAFCTTPNAMKRRDLDGRRRDRGRFVRQPLLLDRQWNIRRPDTAIDFGDTLLKLNPSGSRVDSFTPFNYATLDASDVDLASGGIILLPDQSGAHRARGIDGRQGRHRLPRRPRQHGRGRKRERQARSCSRSSTSFRPAAVTRPETTAPRSTTTAPFTTLPSRAR